MRLYEQSDFLNTVSWKACFKYFIFNCGAQIQVFPCLLWEGVRTILNKLFLSGGACYVIRSMVHVHSNTTLKLIYLTYFCCTIKQGIIFGGNSSNSGKIHALQKKVVRIMAGAQPRNLCRSLLKKLQISAISCHYILSLMNFVVNKQENFQTNSWIHNIKTKNKLHFHKPNASLSCFQKSTFQAGIRIFNRVPHTLIILENEKAKFKVISRKYLNTHCFTLQMNLLCIKMIHNTVL